MSKLSDRPSDAGTGVHSGTIEINGHESNHQHPVILLVDDDEMVRQANRRMLTRAGMQVIEADSAIVALTLLERSETAIDVVVSDIIMPGMDGVSLLREVRRHNLDVPVVLITGHPQLETAISAVNCGAFRYHSKPLDIQVFIATVAEAVSLHRLARLKRDALALLQSHQQQLGDRASLEVHFAQAIDGVWMAYQPIVDLPNRRLVAYEALLRSTSTVLGTPMALLDAAERLDRVHDLGRRIRRLVAEHANDAPNDVLLFVNLHASDLNDAEMFQPTSPLSKFAHRVVLEVTERCSLEQVSGIAEKMAALRTLGYRIAVDDLGAGYAGLSSFSQLEPEYAKLDMSLIRGIDASVRLQSIVRAMIDVCSRELKVEVICEGVETEAERTTLDDLGATWLQGYLFGRPMRGFEPAIIDGERCEPTGDPRANTA